MTPAPAAPTPWAAAEDLVLALLVRDAVAAAAGVANLKAQGLMVYPAALTAALHHDTWLGVSNVLAAGAAATSVSTAATALSQVSVRRRRSCCCCCCQCSDCYDTAPNGR